MAGTTRTTTPNRYVLADMGRRTALHCDFAAAAAHPKISIANAAYRLSPSYPTLLIHPDGRLSHTWPPRATPIPPPPRRSPETGGRQIRIPNPNLPPVLEPSNRTHPSVPKCPPSHKRGFEFSPPSLGPPFRCTGPDGNPPEPTLAKIPPPSTPSACTTAQRYLAGCHRSKVPTRPPIGRINRCIAEAGPLPIRSAEDRLPREASTTRTHATHPHHTNTLPMGIHSRPSREQHNEAVWSSLRSLRSLRCMGGRSGQQQTHTPSSAFHHPALGFSAGAGSPIPYYLFNPVFCSHTR